MSRIYILHGWSYSKGGVDPLQKWQPLIEELKKNNVEANLLKIPVLSLASEKVFNLDDYVEWLEKVLKNTRDKVILIGHSNGGRISLAFTQRNPARVKKLILIDSAGIYHNELPIRLKRLIFGFIAKVGKKLTSSEKFKILLYKLAREGDYLNATPTQRQTMINLINQDLTPILKEIKPPTLIIWGMSDKITPLSDGRKMHQFIANSKMEVIKKAGHAPQFTHTEEVAKLITKFIKQ